MLWAPALLAAITTCLLLPLAASAQQTAIFINEIHYDNTGTDTQEGVEVAAPAGSDLDGWTIVFYNGKNGTAYASVPLTGEIPDAQAGHGTLGFPTPAIQNGAPDGIALVDPTGAVVQLLSYEGIFVAVDGPATGRESDDIGGAEDGSTPVGHSLQLAGIGSRYEDFRWSPPQPSSFGSVNGAQSFGAEIPHHPIHALQGAGHTSPHVGELVESSGVVTWVTGHGFFLQDRDGDDDPRTSDALFVYTGDAPAQSVGDRVTVRGQVNEYVPGGADTHNLSTTELRSFDIETLARGTALPPSVVVGLKGRLPPTEIIDDDGLTSFDPEEDGIDFFESLEAMRVELPELRVVAPQNGFGEVYGVLPGDGRATGLNRNGGITIRPADFNPERVKIQLSPDTTPPIAPAVGDALDGVTGVLSYSFGNFELLPTASFGFLHEPVARAKASLRRGTNQLTVASFNLRNLGPDDADRMNRIAVQIVYHLATPDLIGVQEVQDDDGSVDSGRVGARLTAAALIAAIEKAGGPTYAYLDLPPTDGQDGGKPGANIRVAYLYDPNRVVLALESTRRIVDPRPSDGDAFKSSRKPLVATFRFNGASITFVNTHFTSRRGSDPLFGSFQPPGIGGASTRAAQAREVKAFVADALTRDSDALFVVLGDMNEFWFGEPLKLLVSKDPDGLLENLDQMLAPEERYSYLYQGNSQQLDHILASPQLSRHAAFEIVHLNAEFADSPSDHDPVLARFDLSWVPEPSPDLLALACAIVLGRLARRPLRSKAPWSP